MAQNRELEIGQTWKGVTRKGLPDTRRITSIGAVKHKDGSLVKDPAGRTLGDSNHVQYEQNGEPNAWAFHDSAETAELIAP